MPLSRGGASAASEHGVAACHLCGELETETHGLPFTDWLATDAQKRSSVQATYRASPGYGTLLSPISMLEWGWKNYAAIGLECERYYWELSDRT